MKQLDHRAVWFFFIKQIAGSIITILVGFYVVYSVGSTLTGDVGNITFSGLSLLYLLILIVGIIFSYIWARLSWHFYRYELREDGFRKEHGIIYKKYVTIPYDRIQNVDIYRGIVARFLGISDVQIQTAGGITGGSYGAFSEGRLPGVSKEDAEMIRDELIRRAKQSKNQGL